MTLDDRIAEWLIRRPRNPLRLPEQPRIRADVERDAAFDRLIEGGGRIDYRLPYAKHELLARAVAAHGVLLHGSNDDSVEVFEPREQTTYRGRPTKAVFATPDPIWPIFFAVVDRTVANSLWNQCLMELPGRATSSPSAPTPGESGRPAPSTCSLARPSAATRLRASGEAPLRSSRAPCCRSRGTTSRSRTWSFGIRSPSRRGAASAGSC